MESVRLGMATPTLVLSRLESLEGHNRQYSFRSGGGHRPPHSCLERSVDAVATCTVWRRRDEGLGLHVGGQVTTLDGLPSVHAI